MPRQKTFVIVGASLAGARAAETLRVEGFDGRVVLVGDEPVRPYERPPLSKTYLRGESDFDAAAVHDAGFYQEHDIDLLTSTSVTGLDPLDKKVVLDPGGELDYDELLLTTGAIPRHLSVPGGDLAGIHYLRSLSDCDDLRAGLESANRVVVVGAGWIGAEVAASAREFGKEVAMVGLSSAPMEQVLGPEVGNLFAQLHTERGVELHMGQGVQEIRGGHSAEEVVLTDGTALSGDLVVVGIGVLPRTELGERAGAEVNNGIAVDRYLSSSVAGIWAAGDVANAYHPIFDTHIRLEHWSSALNQGPVAAVNMLGKTTPYDRVPYFFSDQYDLGLEYSGYVPGGHYDEVVLRGDVGKREFIAFWMGAGRVLAGMNVNVWDVTEDIQVLVRSSEQIDPVKLANLDVALDDIHGLAEGSG